VFSDDLGNLGIILGSHRTPVFEMSSWNQALDIRFMLLAHSFGSFPIAWMQGTMWQYQVGKYSKAIYRFKSQWVTGKANATKQVISSFSLSFLVYKMRVLDWISPSQTIHRTLVRKHIALRGWWSGSSGSAPV
jgi:hypothetical protein